MSLEKYVEKIQAQCTWVAGNHLRHNITGFQINGIPQLKIGRINYKWSKIMYASFYGQDLKTLGHVHRICQDKKCLNPIHYVEKEHLVEDGTEKDGNGWNETLRRKLWGQLHLLDHPPTDTCIIPKTADKRWSVSICPGEKSLAANVCLRLKLKRPLKPGCDASHICHIPGCVNSAHLTEETRTENINRSFADNKMKRKKLSDENVMDIYREKLLTTRQLAKKYGIAQATVAGIRSGRSHGRVTKDPRFKSLYVAAKDIQITEIDRKIVAKQLKQGSTEVQLTADELKINPQLQGTVHWIANNAPDHAQYVPFGFKYGSRYGHILAAVVKYELDHLPSQSGNSQNIVRHLCRDRRCCNLAHIELGTALQNNLDKRRDGTAPKFITDPDILEKMDVDLKEEVLSGPKIAEKYNVPYHRIQTRRCFLRKEGHVFVKTKILGKRKRA